MRESGVEGGRRRGGKGGGKEGGKEGGEGGGRGGPCEVKAVEEERPAPRLPLLHLCPHTLSRLSLTLSPIPWPSCDPIGR
eukprot:2545101-Rhodomonas_salina.2